MPIKDSKLLLPPCYMASVHYYAALNAAAEAVIDTRMHFDKRMKHTHRCSIADVNGPLMLTVPVEKPASLTTAHCDDIVVSSHGHWWNVHLTALKSAYGRTPFFEYYLDDFAPLLSSQWVGKKITEHNAAIDTLLRRLLAINTKVSYIDTETDDNNLTVADYRRRHIDFTTDVPYYQIRSREHGFLPSLSVVDLLFNMGPEAQIILHRMVSE
ncbi:MAG: WbqC family protein [Paramuribaculum sp.]|nr:WbqC family protein [Paramuribaculum sp.]